MSNPRKYTAEFKREAVQLALNSPSVVSAAKDLGMPEVTLHTWVHRAKQRGETIDLTTSEPVNVGEVIKENQ
mgnify:CR=1 FL=1